MRIWEKKVAGEDAGKTLEKILKGSGFSKKEISRLKFRENGLAVDGRQCRSTEILTAGQEIRLCLDDGHGSTYAAAQKLPPVRICYEDADLLILDKPSGIPCHPGRGHFGDSLGEQAAAYLKTKGEENALRLIGRLDKDTSGAVVFARNRTAAARLWKQKEEGVFFKTYEALVHGEPDPSDGRIDLPLEPVPGQKNRIRAAAKGADALTFYRTKKIYDTGTEKFSLVECRLGTGRTHQIRVHMASKGHPILGDPFYGCGDGVPRLCLHAGKAELRQPFTKERICIQIFSPFSQLDLDYLSISL